MTLRALASLWLIQALKQSLYLLSFQAPACVNWQNYGATGLIWQPLFPGSLARGVTFRAQGGPVLSVRAHTLLGSNHCKVQKYCI